MCHQAIPMMGAIRPFDRVYEIVIVLDFPSFSLIELDDQTRTERSIPMLWSEIEACCVLCLSSIVRHGCCTVLDLSQKISPHFKTKDIHSTFNESFWCIIGSSDHIYILPTHDSFWYFLTAIKDSLITLLSGPFCHSNLKVKLVIMSYDINWSTKTSFLSTVIKTFNRLNQGGPGGNRTLCSSVLCTIV